MKFLLSVIALAVASFATNASANLIINGDFEDNTAAGSLFNMTNADFTATVTGATGFGTSEEMDFVTGTSFGIAPQSGDWKVGMHSRDIDGPPFDAFSFALAGPLSVGETYDLSFWAAGISIDPFGLVEIGLSTSATDFGTLVFSGSPLSFDSWTELSSSFMASIAATFLTVRVGNPRDGFAFVDNFSLTGMDVSDVPLPAAAPLFALGVFAFGAAKRRKANKIHA